MRTVTRDGHTFDVEPVPGEVDFWTLYENGTWEPDTFDILNEHLDHDVTFVDIGAWCGPFTLYASQICRHVYAVEPDRAALAMLRANIEANRIDNVTVLDMMVAPTGGYGTIGRTPGGEWGDSMTSTLHTEDTKKVWGITIDELLAFTRDVGLVKIDIEGAEADILTGPLPYPTWLSLHAPLAGPDYATKLSWIGDVPTDFADVLV